MVRIIKAKDVVRGGYYTHAVADEIESMEKDINIIIDNIYFIGENISLVAFVFYRKINFKEVKK